MYFVILLVVYKAAESIAIWDKAPILEKSKEAMKEFEEAVSLVY